MKSTMKFAALITVILGTLTWLAVSGMGESKAYYKTIPEVASMNHSERTKRFRVAGDVEQGSIKREGKEVRFTIFQEGHKLNVRYVGTEPLPDTFRDGAQALADGHLMADGTFEAKRIQAKCASKYEAKPGGKPGAAPVYTAPQKVS